MHTFTKQQHQGGVKYAPKTLVGNWSEDMDLHFASMKDFLLRKQTGSLKVDLHQERMRVALQKVEMSKIRDDPYVHFGDVLQLVQLKTGSLLAVDVEDKDPCPGELTCAASATSELLEPLARNTFLISKYVPSQPTPLEPQWMDDVLHYGQKVRLLANPLVQGEPLDAQGGRTPLALFSRPLGVTCAAKYSRHQLVGFTWRPDNYDSVWQVTAIDPADRLACEGVEVAAGAPILLIHCATQAPLNLEEGVAHPNRFGMTEAEVSAHAVMSTGKQLSLEHASRGETSRCLPKPQLSNNHWAFVTGSVVASLPAVNFSVGDLERLMTSLHDKLQGIPGALALFEQKLVRMSDAGGCLKIAELVMAVRQVGGELSEDDAAAIAAELAVQAEEQAVAAATVMGVAGSTTLTSSTARRVNVQAFMNLLGAAAGAADW